jgi:hypothetical protein
VRLQDDVHHDTLNEAAARNGGRWPQIALFVAEFSLYGDATARGGERA